MRTGGVCRRRGAAAFGAALSLAVLAGCVADPPPPTVVGEEQPDGEGVRRTAGGVLLSLDRVDEGFNPHLLADQGIDTDLVASLVLPSAFVPGADGELELNDGLLESAGPLPDDPHTVRYTIRQKAQWSDGVPVAAEDFSYLWLQMTTQSGVVDPAGYEHIVDVRPGAGGKVVDVVFDTVPRDWRSLFRHLLPGHILREAPDGFQGALRRPPVTSAGPYMIRTSDVGRGEIEFVRNDRYWADAPAIGQLLVWRASGAGELGAALRTGPGSLAVVAGTPVAEDVTATVPGVGTETLRAPVQLEMAFNTVAPAASDPAVRRALTSAVDPDVVGRIVTGQSAPTVTSFPFPAGAPTPRTGDPEAVRAGLADAGFVRRGERWLRDGDPLSVTLGVVRNDDVARTAAYTVVDQLRTAGIGARVWELDPVALHADALPHGLVDAVVGWQRVDGDADTAALSRFACAAPAPVAGPEDAGAPGTPVRPPTTVTSLVPPPPDLGPTTGTETSTPATTTTPSRSLAPAAPARGSGVSGVCDPDLDAALGAGAPTESPDPARPPDLDEAGGIVTRLALRVPLVRPGYLFAGSGVTAAAGRTPQTDRGAGPDRTVPDVFDTAPTWRRNG